MTRDQAVRRKKKRKGERRRSRKRGGIRTSRLWSGWWKEKRNGRDVRRMSDTQNREKEGGKERFRTIKLRQKNEEKTLGSKKAKQKRKKGPREEDVTAEYGAKGKPAA